MSYYHISPATPTTPSRSLLCRNPLKCPYNPKNPTAEHLANGAPQVHGDQTFTNDALQYAAEINNQITQTLAQHLQNGQPLDTPQLREYIAQKLHQQNHPPIRNLKGEGYANNDPWAPWTTNGTTPQKYTTQQQRQQLQQQYPQASTQWLNKKIQLETRKTPNITNYGQGDTYNLDTTNPQNPNRNQNITGTPHTNQTPHPATIHPTNPHLKNNTIQLDPTQTNHFLPNYDTNPPTPNKQPHNPHHPDLHGLTTQNIQTYTGPRNYYTPQTQHDPTHQHPTAILPPTNKPTPRHQAGQTTNPNPYHTGALQLTSGTRNPINNTITTQTIQTNDQNGNHTQTPNIYEPIYNRNTTILTINTAEEANIYQKNFITYDETTDTHTTNWTKLKNLGIDIVTYNECKENWDNAPNPQHQLGFNWHGLDHTTQTHILNPDAIIGWVKYTTGERYAPYNGARGGAY